MHKKTGVFVSLKFKMFCNIFLCIYSKQTHNSLLIINSKTTCQSLAYKDGRIFLQYRFCLLDVYNGSRPHFPVATWHHPDVHNQKSTINFFFLFLSSLAFLARVLCHPRQTYGRKPLLHTLPSSSFLRVTYFPKESPEKKKMGGIKEKKERKTNMKGTTRNLE